MPRACVIVLDAVGAGELPDAAEYGDEGSNTLGNVARAVGGLDLPALEALGLGNVMPLEGCPPQPGAPASPAGCSSARRARTRRPATGS
jgi:phosphopentomutase